MPNDPQPRLIPTATVARTLGVGTSTVHRLAEAGELKIAERAPGIRGAMLFRRSDVERLAARRAKAAAKRATVRAQLVACIGALDHYSEGDAS